MSEERKFIPLFTPDLREEDIQAASKVIRSGMLVQGKNVQELENKFCEITGAKNAVALSNGTATLHLILHAYGIGAGDEVIIPAFSYIATANVIELVGAKPIFVDIEPGTFNIDPSLVEAKITPRTKAIMPVHEFGLSANLIPLIEIAQKHNILLLEDAACAIGSEYKNIPTGSLSLAASFSLHPRKAITSGEGGVVVTSDDALAEKLCILRNHGISMRNGDMDFVEAGFNYRMTDFQAALVLSQIPRLKEQIAYKRKIADIYNKTLDTKMMQLPVVPDYASHTWQTYHVVLNDKIDRKKLISDMKELGIGTNNGAQCMPATTYYQQKYKHNCEVEFPHALRAYKQGLALPMYSGLAEDDAMYVAQQLNNLINKQYAG